MIKLAALTAFLALGLAACGGGGSSTHDAPSPDDIDAATGMTDAGTDAPTDGSMTSMGNAPARLYVTGAKRLTGAGGLVVDVEVGHPMDQGVRTAGSIVVRGGAAVFGN